MLKIIVSICIKTISVFVYPFFLFSRNIVKPFIIIIRSELFKKWLKSRGAKVGLRFRVGARTIIKAGKEANVMIGKNVHIGDDVFLNIRNGASLIVEDNVHINKGSRISAFQSITIKRDTLIASYCNILDHNHSFDLKTAPSTNLYNSDTIIIEEGVWLGTKVQINKGVKIGRFSVVAANSVVTKDIPQSSIFGGIPAKRIK